jgi:hypothetical protein
MFCALAAQQEPQPDEGLRDANYRKMHPITVHGGILQGNSEKCKYFLSTPHPAHAPRSAEGVV